MPDEFQTLRFAARQGVQRLAESQITESNFIQHIERIGETLLFADPSEELDRFAHGQLEHVVNRLVVQFNFQHVRLESFPFAFGTADIQIAQELHLDLFEPSA